MFRLERLEEGIVDLIAQLGWEGDEGVLGGVGRCTSALC